MELKIFSFFSGSGFLDLGFELNGFSIELVNEISPAFMNAYRYSRARMGLGAPKYGYSNIDVNEYLGERAEELRAYVADARKGDCAVGFIGGPPCPDFSVAGKQRGRNGDNGKLSLTYVRLILAQKPDFFLFENVKGLWKTAKHREFYEELKAMLSEAGYCMTDRLTNALEFGAPQDRDRILLFGVWKERLPQGAGDSLESFPWKKYAAYSLPELRRVHWPATQRFQEDGTAPCPPDVPRELTVQYWFEKNGVESHPNGRDCFVPHTGIARMRAVDEGDDSKKSYKRLHRWRYSPTVAYGNNEVHLHPYKARRLTVAEALALQSLPREFALPPEMSLTDKFKTTGNGVPFLLASGIAKTIRDYVKGALNMTTKYTAYNLVRAISLLPRNQNYNYVNPKTPGLIRIENVLLPAGPIQIRRWNPSKGKTYADVKVESISSEMIWRVANAVNPGEPINLDRILGASYNTRSVLEALMALTPEFYYCYPGRIKDIDGHSSIEHGHKHLIWLPDSPHEQGVLTEKQVPNMAISEIPVQSVTYDNLILPDDMTVGGEMDIEVVRRHTQIQIALYLIGLQLDFRTWIAQNDRGILYRDRPLLEQPGIISALGTENIISAFPGAEPAARFIDCIWFQDHRYMPAVMEVEHTTGVTSGLTRMKGLQDAMPALSTRYVIVAPDSDREKVIEEANRPQFVDLDARYFAYSAVEELYYLCTHRKLRGVGQEFLDCFMEKTRVN